MMMRMQLGSFDPNEQEFRDIFKLKKPFDDDYSNLFGMAAGTKEEKDKRKAAEKEMNDQIKATLGDDRYAEYTRAQDYAYQGIYRTTDRFAPHNLYTTSDKLDALLSRLGFAKPSEFTPSPRKTDAPNPTPPHPNIHIDYSYAGYQVDYKYDPSTNDYARSLSGAPHVDRNTGKQIHVKNVVIEMMPTSYGTTRIGESTVIMQTVGSGQGWVLRDGDAVPVTWKKDSHSARTQLLDAGGKDVPLDAGNTWYSIVPVGKAVSY